MRFITPLGVIGFIGDVTTSGSPILYTPGRVMVIGEHDDFAAQEKCLF